MLYTIPTTPNRQFIDEKTWRNAQTQGNAISHLPHKQQFKSDNIPEHILCYLEYKLI